MRLRIKCEMGEDYGINKNKTEFSGNTAQFYGWHDLFYTLYQNIIL